LPRVRAIRARVASWALVLLLAPLPSVGQRSGNTWRVDCIDGQDSKTCGWYEAPCRSVQAALDRAADGDRIDLLPGRCSGKGNVGVDFLGKQVVLVGRTDLVHGAAQGDAPGGARDVVEIDCQGAGRGLIFRSGEGGAAEVRDLTVRNCRAAWGAAVLAENAAPTLRRVAFAGNRAERAGGAVFWRVRGPRLVDCTFSGNSAGSYGPDQASDTLALRFATPPPAALRPGAAMPELAVEAVDAFGQACAALRRPRAAPAAAARRPRPPGAARPEMYRG